MILDIRIQSAGFDVARQIERLGEYRRAATCAFLGRVEAEEGLEEAVIDHHPALARSELARIAGEAEEAWPLHAAILLFRHGRIEPGAPLFFVGVAAPAPGPAFEACAWLVEQARRRAPFWRKDRLSDGSERWFGA